jgi:CBS-domain-containing membrane protein
MEIVFRALSPPCGTSLALIGDGRRVAGTWYGRHEPLSGGLFFCAQLISNDTSKLTWPMATAYDRRLSHKAASAADLMSGSVTTISYKTSFSDAVALFIDQNLSIALVTGDHGEPVGVLTLTDLLIHVRESLAAGRIPMTDVAALMTPTVFSIRACATVDEVIRDMTRSHVHHLFVTDEAGTMMGVVNACDILCHIHGKAQDLTTSARDVTDLF